MAVAVTRERIIIILSIAPFLAALLPPLALAQQAVERTSFRVKYIAQGAVYLDGGRAAGLKEGQKLLVRRAVVPAGPASPGAAPAAPSGIIATLHVISVAAASAVCEIDSSTEPVRVGDTAQLAGEEVKAVQEERRLSGMRAYPQLVTFDALDPVIEEARASVPRPPSPEINRIRGRIGFEYSTVLARNNPTTANSEVGMVARLDMTRIAGSYWNFSGYWRGRFSSLSGGGQPATITDMINRTYHASLIYDNPNSRWVAGGGRLYLPWASSLDTMDGGYFGRKYGERTTAGVFAGTTPDPSSYDYNPDRRMGGAFVNLSGGSYEDFRYTTTFGVALTSLGWHAERQFAFLETGFFFKRYFSLYESLQVDAPHAVVSSSSGAASSANPATTSTGGVNRSFLTLRYQPHRRFSLDLSHTYFRDFPTFDPALIGTGLLDRYLFQGLNVGGRIELPKKITLSTGVGRSSRTGDARSSWNQFYGVTLAELWHTGVRVDLRYSRFSSAFGSGNYRALSLSKQFSESFRWDLQGGLQSFASPLTNSTQSHFVNTYLDWSPGKILFFQAGYTWQRGGSLNYDQMLFTIGRRF
jgi:hypothetical protein